MSIVAHRISSITRYIGRIEFTEAALEMLCEAGMFYRMPVCTAEAPNLTPKYSWTIKKNYCMHWPTKAEVVDD